MLLTATALVAFAALLTGTASARPGESGTIPYLSHGIGVDQSLFAGTQSQPGDLAGSYPSHVIGAGASQWDGRTLPTAVDVSGEDTYQVPRRRVTNGSRPSLVIGAGESQRDGGPAAGQSSGNDFDWTSFAAGAGTAALLAAALMGVVSTARRRHSVGLP